MENLNNILRDLKVEYFFTSKEVGKPTKTGNEFIEWEYKGDGKYRLEVPGSKRYGKSHFYKFAKFHSDCFTIKSVGNDAPRGGRTGNFVMVQFSPLFHQIYNT